MKIAKYPLLGGGVKEVEYDENALCIFCGEPVVEASMGGTVICPWCDCGNCRYCGEKYLTGRETTNEGCIAVIKRHIKQHKESNNEQRTETP